MYENKLVQEIRKAVNKDYAYLAYRLPYRQNKGILETGEEEIETEPYSFTEISSLVKKAFEEEYPIKQVIAIGFRGEIFVNEAKQLKIYATGGARLMEYTVSNKEEGFILLPPAR